MRAFFEVGPTDQPPPPAAPGSFTDAERFELELLRDQLGRMRGMLYKFTNDFFRTIHLWAAVSIALLVVGSVDGWGAAVLVVPFVVPFAFLETAYLFFYTVYARRHAERLEMALNERLGRDVLVAHRTEAAYLYPPDRPKVAFLSFGNPLGMSSVMTVGYTAGAAFLWIAGVILSAGFVAAAAPGGLIGLVVPAQVVWTAAVALYLVGYFLARRDEDRLLGVLGSAYRAPSPFGPSAAVPATGAATAAASAGGRATDAVSAGSATSTARPTSPDGASGTPGAGGSV
jgi:hypothetical protein